MKLTVQNGLRANDRARVDVSKIGAGELGLEKAASKSLKRILSFGAYSKYVDNPRQWTAFRQAVTTLREQGRTNASESQIDTLFSTYNTHKRLTQSKAANILADLERIDANKTEPAARQPKRLNASQNALARAWRTVFHGGLDAVAGQLKDKAAGVLREASAAKAGALARDSVRLSGGSDGEFALVDEAMSPADLANAEREAAGRAVLDILRPGRMMDSASIEKGQEALASYASDKGVLFGHSAAPMKGVALLDHLNDVLVDMVEPFIVAARDNPDNAGQSAIYSIPFGMESRGGSEDHSVEIAVDYTNRKILYLDAKGHSIDYAERNYKNQDNMRAVLTEFGQQLFGTDWQPQTGILELTQAKQQGANDCGAFTHTFTRELIDGKSVGDIERSFDANARARMRLDMAQDIDRAFLGDTEPRPVVGAEPRSTAVDRNAVAAGLASFEVSATDRQDAAYAHVYVRPGLIMAARQEVEPWLAGRDALKSRVTQGLEALQQLAQDDVTARRQMRNDSTPLTNALMSRLLAEPGSSWLRDDPASIATALATIGAGSVEALLQSNAATIGQAREALEGLRMQMLQAVPDVAGSGAVAGGALETRLDIAGGLAIAGRAVRDVPGDGHCLFHALAHAEGDPGYATTAAVIEQRTLLLSRFADLGEAQAARIGDDRALAEAFSSLLAGMGQPSVDQNGWGRREHLQLKALQTERTVIALTPQGALVCQPDGQYGEVKTQAALRDAIEAAIEPLYVIDTGQGHWQSTVAA